MKTYLFFCLSIICFPQKHNLNVVFANSNIPRGQAVDKNEYHDLARVMDEEVWQLPSALVFWGMQIQGNHAIGISVSNVLLCRCGQL
jgi:hypothetical protein